MIVNKLIVLITLKYLILAKYAITVSGPGIQNVKNIFVNSF